MYEIELYDIITLKDNKKYTVTSKINKDNKTYAMLVEIDDEENPIPNNVKIVEILNNNSTIKEITDDSILKLVTLELSKKTIEELNKEN
jgi:hypothetical protein